MFFTLEDVTRPVSAMSREIEEQVDAMQRVIGAKAHPEIQIGPHCDNPYTCPLHGHLDLVHCRDDVDSD